MPAPHGLPDPVAGAAAAAWPPGGTPLHLRPLASDDRERLAAAFAALSERTRYLRFLGPKPSLSARELTYLTEIDHRTHEALVAVDPADGRLVAVARYAPVPDEPGTADFAVVVADEWQGRGVGLRVSGELLRRAAANGVRRLTASTLDENRVARGLLRRLGFRTVGFGGSVVDLELAFDGEHRVSGRERLHGRPSAA
jgi:RimJ/RimL family protein N-acetyltransferase